MRKALVLAGACALAGSAFAGVFASENFESTTGWAYTYAYAITAPYTLENVPNSGPDGTTSSKLTMNFTGVPMAPWGSTFYGAGLGTYMGTNTQPMSTILSEYTASFQAKVVGTWNGTGHSNIKMELQFFCFDDTNPDGTPMATPDADEDSQLIGGFSYNTPQPRLAEGVWESRSATFDQFVGNDIDGDGPGTDVYQWSPVQTALAAGNLHGMNLHVKIEDGADADGRYGADAGNEFWADNYQVSVVPEPSALAALAMAGLILGRRRK